MSAPAPSRVDKPYLYYSIAFSILILGAVSLPFFLTGDPILQINDNLDGTNLVLLHALKRFGLLFSFDATVPMLHGVSRLFFPSEFKVWGLLLYFFDDFLHAYLLNYLLKLAVGYASMLLFLDNVLTRGRGNPVLMRLTALCFAILPCQPENALPFATVPLILYMFDLLYRKESGRAWLLISILCYPLISDFSRFGLYIIAVLGLFFLYDAITKKRIHLFFAFGIFLLGVGYIATEYRLFYAFLFLKGETVRKEFQLGNFSYFDLSYILSQTANLFFNGQYHFSEAVHTYVVLPSIVLFMVISNVKKELANKTANRLMMAFAAIIVIRFAYLLVIVKYANLHSALFRLIQLDRVYIFMPIILYSLFYIVLECAYKRITPILSIAIASAQALCIVMTPSLYNDAIKNIRYTTYIKQEYGYKEFFSEPLFEKIKKAIHYTGEWSVAVGFHPSILLHNGIHTLDGYHSYYPLPYKHAFRAIIAPELEKDSEMKEYFDYWGCRVYIFNNDANKPDKGKIAEPTRLDINPEAFTRLDGKYVFSRAQISNSADLHLDFLGEFTDPSSPYFLYVYANTARLNAR